MSSTNYFIFPGSPGTNGDFDSAVHLQYGSQQEINWTTSYTTGLNLALIQQQALPVLDTLATNTTDTSYFWNGRPTQNLGLGDIFFMAMYNSSESGPPLFRSQYINVTMSASSSSVTTSSLSSTASSSSSHPTVQPNTTPVSTTATTIPTASSTPKPTANHVALGAGLGVGLGGAALLLAGGLSFFLSRKRHSKSRKRTPEVYQLAENDRFSQ